MKLTFFILAYIISSSSLTWMLVHASVFQWLRNWANKKIPIKGTIIDTNTLERGTYSVPRPRRFFPKVLGCSLCLGFHVGYLNATWVAIAYFLCPYMIILNAALSAALITFLVDKWITKLDTPAPNTLGLYANLNAQTQDRRLHDMNNKMFVASTKIKGLIQHSKFTEEGYTAVHKAVLEDMLKSLSLGYCATCENK